MKQRTNTKQVILRHMLKEKPREHEFSRGRDQGGFRKRWPLSWAWEDECLGLVEMGGDRTAG